MCPDDEPTINVPLSEILELIRLATKIELPTVTFLKGKPFEMANEVIANSQEYAANINSILYKWTH